jgi:alpha-ketoglutarate-dependent 2,4-dichlorophenoxyacetate dioxygenase
MTLTIKPLGQVLAAEVVGIDIRAPLAEPVSAAIREALAHHLVLVFPGEPLSDEQQIAFSRVFGPLETTRGANPSSGTVFARQSNIDLDTGGTIAADDRRMLYQKANMLWHSDSSFKQTLSRCSILSAREIPAIGGATEFGSTRAAYETLHANEQRDLEGLVVEHDIVYSRRLVGFVFTPEEASSFHGHRHPLVQDCAVTGRKSVLIGAHARAIIDWPEDKSRALLDGLLARATQSQHTYRHEWRNGDVVVWDNRAVVHRATPYDGTKYRRLMQRTTISMGDQPV